MTQSKLSTADTYLTPKQVAAMPEVCVAAETVRAWIREGSLQAVRVGQRYRVRMSDLKQFLARKEMSDEDTQH